MPTPVQTPIKIPTPTPFKNGYYLGFTPERTNGFIINSTSFYPVPTGYTFINSYTFDPNGMSNALTLSNNNTQVNATANCTIATTYLIPNSGKVMISASLLNGNFPDRGDRVMIGIMKLSYPIINPPYNQLGLTNSACFSNSGGNYIGGEYGTAQGTGISFTNKAALIDLALAMDVQKMWIRVNGVWSGDPIANTGGCNLSTLP
jgi:hypothetical protein